MAYDYQLPAVQTPDIYGAFVRGQLGTQQIQANQQSLQTGQLNQQQLLLAMQMQRDRLARANAAFPVGQQSQPGQMSPLGADQAGTQQNGAQAVGGQPTGGVQQGPQGNGSAQGGSALDDWLTSRSNIMANTRLGMYDAAVKGGDPNTALKTGIETAQAAQSDQANRAKIQLTPFVDRIQTVLTAQNPQIIVNKNDRFRQLWAQEAPKLGLNADDPTQMTPQNVRSVFSALHNEIAAQSFGTIAPINMPNPQEDVKGPNNSIYQRDPLTNGLKQITGEESLHQVIGDNGQPVLLPASQAAGKTPFNQSVFGAANMSDQALQFAADTYRTTGKMPTTMGRNPAMQAKVLEKVAADASANGDTAGAIAARAGALKANNVALDQNQKLLTATSGYLSTMDKNLDNLTQIMGKVDSSGSPLVNKALRAWQQGVTGDADVAKYVTYLSSVQGEFAKLKSGSLGNTAASDSARKEAADVINKYMNNGQISALKDAMHQEGQNRVQSIQEQNQSLMQSMGQGAPGVPNAPSQQKSGTVTLYKNGVPHNIPADKADDARKNYGYQDKP